MLTKVIFTKVSVPYTCQQFPPEAESLLGSPDPLVNDHIPGQGSQLPGHTSIQNGVIGCTIPDAEQPGQDGLVRLAGELSLQLTQLSQGYTVMISGSVSSAECEGPAASSSVTMRSDLLFNFLF